LFLFCGEDKIRLQKDIPQPTPTSLASLYQAYAIQNMAMWLAIKSLLFLSVRAFPL
jgi:hypothetical protein